MARSFAQERTNLILENIAKQTSFKAALDLESGRPRANSVANRIAEVPLHRDKGRVMSIYAFAKELRKKEMRPNFF